MALNNADLIKKYSTTSYTSGTSTPTKTATLSTADRVAQMQQELAARQAQQAASKAAAQQIVQNYTTGRSATTPATSATNTPTAAQTALTRTSTPTTNTKVDNLIAKSNAATQNSIKAATGNTAAITALATPTAARAVTPAAATATKTAATATPAANTATAAKVAQMQSDLAARQAQQAAATRTASQPVVAQTARPASTVAASIGDTNSSTLMPSSVADRVVNLDEPTTATTPEATATPTPATTTPVNTSNTSRSMTVNNTFTPATYTPTGIYAPGAVEAYNEQRQADLRALYEAALQNTLNGMRTAYDQNMSDANAARDQISPQYQRSMSALGAEYERQRRNNNMQAAANGLNTGAGSQMALAQSANYQANQAGLSARENEALNEANRRIGDLQRNYQNAIAEATANNNYKLAAAMMEEYQNAYKRQVDIENTNYQRAQQLDQQNYTRSWNEDERSYSRGVDEANRKAQYGDFSGYRDLYGDDTANLMEQTWAMQNPYQAWASGKLSAADFYALTGKIPSDPNSVAGQLPGGGEAYTGLNPEAESAVPSYSGGYIDTYSSLLGRNPRDGAAALKNGVGGTTGSTGSNYYSKSYSSGRSGGSGSGRGYNGPPGYYNEAGQFIVPDGNGGVAASYGSAQGADRYNTNPNVNGNVSAQGAKDYAEAYARNNGSGSNSSGSNDSGNNNSGGNNTDTGNNWTREDNGNGSVVDAAVGWFKNLFS